MLSRIIENLNQKLSNWQNSFYLLWPFTLFELRFELLSLWHGVWYVKLFFAPENRSGDGYFLLTGEHKGQDFVQPWPLLCRAL